MFFGMGNLLWQFALLGTALALWSIFRIEKRTWSAIGMFAGGLLSTLSYSLGAGTWLACITAIILRRKSHRPPLIVCVLGLAIDVLPNVGTVSQAPARQPDASNPVLRHFLFLANYVRRPLSNYIVLHGRIPMSETAGFVHSNRRTASCGVAMRWQITPDSASQESYVSLRCGRTIHAGICTGSGWSN